MAAKILGTEQEHLIVFCSERQWSVTRRGKSLSESGTEDLFKFAIQTRVNRNNMDLATPEISNSTMIVY